MLGCTGTAGDVQHRDPETQNAGMARCHDVSVRRHRGRRRRHERPHRAGLDRVGCVIGLVTLRRVASLPGVRPQQIRGHDRGVRAAQRRDRRAHCAVQDQHAALDGRGRGTAGSLPRRSAAVGHGADARQPGRVAGERRCDLRQHHRGHRRGPAVRAGAVLHVPRRRARPPHAAGADRAGARRSAGVHAVRRGGQQGAAPALPGGIACRRRAGELFQADPGRRQPLPAQLPQPSQDGGRRRPDGMGRRSQRRRRIPRPRPGIHSLAGHPRQV